jgi:hypothetical protein
MRFVPIHCSIEADAALADESLLSERDEVANDVARERAAQREILTNDA